MAKKRIAALTFKQKARIPEFARKWIDIGLSTKPADRPRAEKAIAGLYRLAKLKEPQVIWLPCPIGAAFSAVSHCGLIDPLLRAHQKQAVEDASALEAQVHIHEAVYAAITLAADSAVGSRAYSTIYSVYSAVEPVVYSAVGSAVGTAVGRAVGSAVRGLALGLAVDPRVRGVTVGPGDRSFFGGSLWAAGYCAWADYLDEVCGVAIDRNYLDAIESCGSFWTLEDVCFASERPAFINRDSDGRLHAEAGQSIQYKGSRSRFWHWHGINIPDEKSWIIAERPRITREAILAEENSELRRVMCEVIGWSRAIELLGGKIVSRDELHGQPRELIDVEIASGESIRLIRLVNGTVESDGTRREFIEGILSELTNPHDAVAWQYGIDPEYYREALRS